MALSRLKAAAAAMGAVALIGAAPLPAQAQHLQFNFGIGIGVGADDFVHRRPLRLCLLTDSQLRRAIRQQGYHDIFLNVANENRIQVRATRGEWVYLLRVNACTGRILARERLRRA